MKVVAIFLVSFVRSACDEPDNYKRCETKYQNRYEQCLVDCSQDDFACSSQCSREYAENVENCPCEVSFEDFMKPLYNYNLYLSQIGCPDGCPCPDYNCISPVLVVNQFDRNIKSVQYDAYGSVRPSELEIVGNVNVRYACSVSFQNRMLLFSQTDVGFPRRSKVETAHFTYHKHSDTTYIYT